YVYVILVFLMAFFYGNVFWVFPKIIRNKNSIVRIGICVAWFIVVFGGNYFVVGPLFNKANPAPQPETRAFTAIPDNEKRDSVIKDGIITLDHPKREFHPPEINEINFTVSSWFHLQPIILFAFLVILG